jgi:hypothetical protein
VRARWATYASEVPRPFRALIAAALGSLLVLTVPTSVGAAGPDGRDAAHLNGFSRTEARQVLHQARTMMQRGPTTALPGARDLTMALRDLRLARPALTGADRRTADRLLSRSYPAARLAQASTTTATAATAAKMICSAHFCLHYGSGTTTQWAQTTSATLEHVWNVEVPLMHRQPLPDGGSSDQADNPNNLLDVYLDDEGSGGYYGYCTSDDKTGAHQVAAYCVLDDDFARRQYGAAPINSLRVTAAHEFFHAIQFAADVTEATWFMEGSATWAEDVVYNSINDNYQYLPSSPIRHPRTPLDYGGGSYPYGSFIFFKYASQRMGNDVVRRFWDGVVGAPRSIQSIHAVVGPTAWPAFFTLFASWNTVPLHSYAERASYPAPSWWVRKTLAGNHTGTGLHSVRIPHLASSAVQVIPSARLSTGKHVLVSVDAPSTWTGSRALLQRRFKDGRVTQTMLPLTASGARHILVPFNHSTLRSVAVVVSNTAATGPARLFHVQVTVR